MWIKVCGLQDPSIGKELARLPVDAVGINRYPESRRFVPEEALSRLVGAIRSADAPPEVVGVYVNAARARILEDADRHALDRVQLHGDESPEDVHRLQEDVPVLKALRVGETFGAEQMERYDVDVFLLDAHEPGRYGGTGRRAPWERIAPLTDRYRIVLAGGLAPDNVREAIQTVSPWGIDVCSGVEDPGGPRDLGAVRKLLDNLDEPRGPSPRETSDREAGS